jgi:hypothetical protein
LCGNPKIGNNIEYDNENRLLPKVYIDDLIFQELYYPWYDSLIIKLLGKNIGYYQLRMRLKGVWKLNGGFELVDISNGFFMVKFDLADDRAKVINRGPWMIFDHYLAVHNWSPEFVSSIAKINKAMLWVWISSFNLVFYDESFLMAIASAIGKSIKANMHTLNVERGHLARICVEIDLDQPIVGRLWIKDNWNKVKYEGLHLICSRCGCYEHLGKDCKVLSSHGVSAEGMVTDEPKATTTRGDRNNGNDFTVQAVNLVIDTKNHNDWLTITKVRKPKNGKRAKLKEVYQGNKFNKFTILKRVDEDISIASQQHGLQAKKDVGQTIPIAGLKFMTQYKKRVRRDEPIVVEPIVKPVIVTDKKRSKIQKGKQKVVHTSTRKHDFNNLNISTPLVFSSKGPDMTREKEDSEQNANGLGRQDPMLELP